MLKYFFIGMKIGFFIRDLFTYQDIFVQICKEMRKKKGEDDEEMASNTDFHGEKRDNGINGWKSVVYAEKNFNSITDAIRSKNVAIFKYFGEDMEPEKYGWDFDDLDE